MVSKEPAIQTRPARVGSELGPFRGGMVQEVWLIVQFRETDRETSCVVHGDHGYALNVKE